jgi:Fe-S oxidoreductase
MESRPFGPFERDFNLSQLIAGSEGTLFFATEIKLACDPLPPVHSGVLCAHFRSIDAALRANIIVCSMHPNASELIDRHVLEGARRNSALKQNMSFVWDDPTAVLMVEFCSAYERDLDERFQHLVERLQASGLGYHFPILYGESAQWAWEVRRAGLGVVANVAGDTKPVTVIEDTAVSVQVLPEYVRELNELLHARYGISCVHYGHAGSGELHLRPLLNLKTAEGRRVFEELASDVARLVKKYKGSLSGEHGDGRLRARFLRQMLGSDCFRLIEQVKTLFDPDNTFNPGKIVSAPPILQGLRYPADEAADHVNAPATVFNFSSTGGLLRAAEMCSGSGDCRKTELSGGTMCPSYMATRDEKDTTRARANILRQVLSDKNNLNPMASQEIKQVLDLCLSCKGCKHECPSNVDMAKMKAEFMNAYQKAHGISFRNRQFASVARYSRWNSRWPQLYNFAMRNRVTSGWIKRLLSVHPNRNIPLLHKPTLRSWHRRRRPPPPAGSRGEVLLFCDEFTNYFDVPVGIAAVELLERLGYRVVLPEHLESGRSAISMGLLDYAKTVAAKNVEMLAAEITENRPLIGLEPSAILTFRDEYIDLVPGRLRNTARELAANSILIEEFVMRETRKGNIDSNLFTHAERTVRLHGHCHQKALASLADTIRMLQLPQNYRVAVIPSGCCGMAGSFGYELEHFEVSMKIGELVLFPAIRKLPTSTLIAAGGTSCRQQILDGTGRQAMHPIQILRTALDSPQSR